MSAFEVSDRHINTLISWAKRHRETLYGQNGQVSYMEAAQMLRDANTESVRARYEGRHLVGGKIEFRDTPDASIPQILKACACLEYQSCEYDGWAKSTACAILRTIEKAAIERLPGYSEAQWAID